MSSLNQLISDHVASIAEDIVFNIDQNKTPAGLGDFISSVSQFTLLKTIRKAVAARIFKQLTVQHNSQASACNIGCLKIKIEQGKWFDFDPSKEDAWLGASSAASEFSVLAKCGSQSFSTNFQSTDSQHDINWNEVFTCNVTDPWGDVTIDVFKKSTSVGASERIAELTKNVKLSPGSFFGDSLSSNDGKMLIPTQSNSPMLLPELENKNEKVRIKPVGRAIISLADILSNRCVPLRFRARNRVKLGKMGEPLENDTKTFVEAERWSSFDAFLDRRVKTSFWVHLYPQVQQSPVDNSVVFNPDMKFQRPVPGHQDYGMNHPPGTLGLIKVSIDFTFAHPPALSFLLANFASPSTQWRVPTEIEPHFLVGYGVRLESLASAAKPAWVDQFFHLTDICDSQSKQHILSRPNEKQFILNDVMLLGRYLHDWIFYIIPFWIYFFHFLVLAPLWQAPLSLFICLLCISLFYRRSRQRKVDLLLQYLKYKNRLGDVGGCTSWVIMELRRAQNCVLRQNTTYKCTSVTSFPYYKTEPTSLDSCWMNKQVSSKGQSDSTQVSPRDDVHEEGFVASWQKKLNDLPESASKSLFDWSGKISDFHEKMSAKLQPKRRVADDCMSGKTEVSPSSFDNLDEYSKNPLEYFLQSSKVRIPTEQRSFDTLAFDPYDELLYPVFADDIPDTTITEKANNLKKLLSADQVLMGHLVSIIEKLSIFISWIDPYISILSLVVILCMAIAFVILFIITSMIPIFYLRFLFFSIIFFKLNSPLSSPNSTPHMTKVTKTETEILEEAVSKIQQSPRPVVFPQPIGTSLESVTTVCEEKKNGGWRSWSLYNGPTAAVTYLHNWWTRIPDRREIDHRCICASQVIFSIYLV
eukprot:GHVL01019289.1.p1 GENE.GHVL01019289.1~~GHVL01019289.1.p1  ORF type:complete len:867 (-),score=135.20 GHVL01019289.1:824-3424(-)